jgi:YfiH family protein
VPLPLRSTLLQDAGFVHGFSTRTGGSSQGPFASLNLGRAVGDDSVNVEENHRRLAAAVGYAAPALFETSQVHGARVRVVGAAERPADVRGEQADALAAREAGVTVGVRVADCLPLLLGCAETGAVAAVHCGWRGVAAGVVGRAVDALRGLGARPGALVAAIGPHIRACCFEVGDEVVDALAAAAGGVHGVAGRSAAGRPLVALAAVVRAQLAAAGALPARVDDVPGCTRCDPARFYSFRRDGARSGRHLAAISVRATPRA